MEKNRQTLSYADCNYQCVPCGVGYSNGQDESARTMIHACHLDNLPKGPEGLRTDLENCLANAANVQNRSNKRNKFAFSTSEDALTWSVFWYLAHTNQLASALGDENSDSATLFLWGCPVNNDPSSVQSKLHVIQVDELGETPNSKSEPDVIVETDTRLFFVESKLGSPNPCNPNYQNWNKYLREGETSSLFRKSEEEVKQAGLEELTRNWVIGNLLANRLDKAFELVNLGPNSVESSSNQFAELVDQAKAAYRFLSWSSLIGNLNQPVEEWFQAYLKQKHIG